jgi:hypothetical protein
VRKVREKVNCGKKKSLKIQCFTTNSEGSEVREVREVREFSINAYISSLYGGLWKSGSLSSLPSLSCGIYK